MNFFRNNLSNQGLGLISIIIVVAIIAMLGGGGLYFRELKQQKSLQQIGREAEKRVEDLKAKIETQQKDLQQQMNQATPPPAHAKTIDTSNWKTYRNEKYGFEVKYPVKWNFEAISSYDATGKVIAMQSIFFFTDSTLHRVIITPLGFSGGEGQPSDIVETQSINLNGTIGRWRKFADSGGVYKITVDQFSIKQYPQFKIALIPINARPYIDLEKSYEFNKILSTFKFISLERKR